MTPLEEQNFAQRIVLTVIICLIVLFLMFLIGWVLRDEEAGSIEGVIGEWVPSKWDDHINALERQALDEAFKKHIMQLFSVWVTDAYQPRIPPRALTGARNARDAYIRSMDSIDKREAEKREREKPTSPPPQPSR